MLLLGGSLVTALSSSRALGLASSLSVFPSELTLTGRLFTSITGATASEVALPVSEPIWSVSAVQENTMS